MFGNSSDVAIIFNSHGCCHESLIVPFNEIEVLETNGCCRKLLGPRLKLNLALCGIAEICNSAELLWTHTVEKRKQAQTT